MGNLLILKDVDFSAVAVERLNNELFRQNYDKNSKRTNQFHFRSTGLNIIGLHPTSVSLAEKTVVGVKIPILENYSYKGNLLLKVYKFNETEHIEIGSIPMAQCVGKDEVLIQTEETLFDANHLLGIGNETLPATLTSMPFTGANNGGDTKYLGNDCTDFYDNAYLIFNAIYIKRE